MSQSNIEAALAAAAASAKAASTGADPSTALVQNDANVPTVPSTRPSAADFMNNRSAGADVYLKVSQHGLNLGTNPGLVEGFDATIELSKLRFCHQVRFGNPPKYLKTFDGKRTADGSGQPWTVSLAQAKSVDPGKASDPYNTAEMVFITDDVVKDMKGKEVAKAGAKVGYTPPYTGTQYLFDLLDAVAAHNGDIEKAKVRIKVGYEAKNRNGNNWGNVTFTFVELLD